MPRKISTVQIPDKIAKNLPSYEAIGRAPFGPPGTDVGKRYQAQHEFDRKLVSTLAVGAYGKGNCPQPPEWIAVLIAGAVHFAVREKVLDPASVHLRSSGERASQLWQVVWRALPDSFPEPIVSALYRLMVAEHIPGDTYSSGYSQCHAMQLWKECDYCPGTSSTNQLRMAMYDEGVLSEQVALSAEERIAINRLIVGAKLVGQLILTDCMSQYHW